MTLYSLKNQPMQPFSAWAGLVFASASNVSIAKYLACVYPFFLVPPASKAGQ
jgi:hypothetical protein